MAFPPNILESCGLISMALNDHNECPEEINFLNLHN